LLVIAVDSLIRINGGALAESEPRLEGISPETNRKAEVKQSFPFVIPLKKGI